MNKSELLSYIGNSSQIGGCRHYTLTDGWARGMRATDVDSGAGLRYTVLPDRGMDISQASYKGVNLVYLTCNGETHPAFFEKDGIGWLRTFAGGLLTTCGLTYLGSPCTDQNESLGLHGRYSTLPVRQFNDLSEWKDQYHCRLKGIAEEASLFGHKLRMEREISTICGNNTITISDTVTNFGRTPSPFTLLYHLNFGYPLLSEAAELLVEPVNTVPRDGDALSGISDFRSFVPPIDDYREQVFFHILKGDKKGRASIRVVNRKLGFEVAILYDLKQLPFLTQWKMMGKGEYVLGIEPGNVHSKSRSTLREENILPMLAPGENSTHTLEISIRELP